MDPLLPTDIFCLEVQPGETVPVFDAPSAFRITMAAIDPTAPALVDPENPGAPSRSTLKMIQHYDSEDSEDEDEDDEDIDEEDVAAIERKLGLTDDDDEDDSEEDGDDEAGPSDPQKVLKARAEAQKVNGTDADEDVDTDGLPNGVDGSKKGKAKASDEDEDDEDDESDIIDDMIQDDVELPLCTLDTTQHYQQALNLTIMDLTSVSFKVIGTHSIFLTGNFVEVPGDDEDGDEDDDEEDFDEELDGLIAPYGDDGEEEDEELDSEEDELDDLDDPRIKELGTDDEEEAAPTLVKAKGKNKRPAESEDEEADDLDKLISKTLKSEDAPQVNGEQKLSKKQLKKLKKNDGQAASVAAVPGKGQEDKKAAVKDSPGNGKKVQFAKELEQGPTSTKADTKTDAKKDTKPASKVRVVQGVTIDERKEGSGPGAKKGKRVEMRYIGKLEKDGKIFDSNKRGKGFSFKLGAGEVIKGWDIGLEGIKIGGERRLTIPANLAYGSQKMPDIPPNSTLIFDVKCLNIH